MWAREAIQTRKPHLTKSLTLPRNAGIIHKRKVICTQAAINTQIQMLFFTRTSSVKDQKAINHTAFWITLLFRTHNRNMKAF